MKRELAALPPGIHRVRINTLDEFGQQQDTNFSVEVLAR
jgi:hypothetical protein